MSVPVAQMDLFHPLVVNGGAATFIISLGRGLTLGKCFYIVLRGIDYILGYCSLRFPRNRYSTWLSKAVTGVMMVAI